MFIPGNCLYWKISCMLFHIGVGLIGGGIRKFVDYTNGNISVKGACGI